MRGSKIDERRREPRSPTISRPRRSPSAAGIGQLKPPSSILRSKDVDPYRVAPSGPAPPDGDLVPAPRIGAEPGVMEPGIPESPVLPDLAAVWIPLIRPDGLRHVVSYDGIRPLAVPEGSGTVTPLSTVEDPVLKPTVIHPVSLGPPIVAAESLRSP